MQVQEKCSDELEEYIYEIFQSLKWSEYKKAKVIHCVCNGRNISAVCGRASSDPW